MGTKKNFVLATNVILHDYKCVHNFEENDIYIPIVVLEELDHFKKGNEQINFNAREFARELDLIADEKLFKKGADLGEGKGIFKIAGVFPNSFLIINVKRRRIFFDNFFNLIFRKRQ